MRLIKGLPLLLMKFGVCQLQTERIILVRVHFLLCTVFLLLAVQGRGLAACREGDCTNGTGVFVSKDGSVYTGSFRAGKFSGKGNLKETDGSSYDGQFSDGKPN